MTFRKRRKKIRYRGTRTHKRGRKNRTRGSGNRGGVGMSGTGKRADQKKTFITAKYGNTYFGKNKTLRRGNKIKLESISLKTIIETLPSLIKNKVAKNLGDGYEINLPKNKVIGSVDLPFKIIMKVRAITSGAKESIQKSGGSVEIINNS